MRRLALAAAAALLACEPPVTPPPAFPPPAARAFPLPSPLPARYLRTLAYDPGGYDAASPPGGPARVEANDLLLGDLLYHAPSTLGSRARELGISCQTCHPNGAANASFSLPGVSDRPGNADLSTRFFRPGADDGIANAINIPSLRGARYTGPYGHDGRTASLAEFVQGVVTSEFGGAPLPPDELAALVRYVQDLDFLPNAKLDPRSRLTAAAGEAARRGEAVFKRAEPGFDGGSCASCHVPSTFFRDGRVHRLGTARSPSRSAVDGGLETPTLLGIVETAPYFHDGRFATLGEVISWFDASYDLGLDARDRADLEAYLEAVGGADRPRDDRPPARRKNETFAYIALVDGSRGASIAAAAIDAALAELVGEPPQVSARVRDARARLVDLRERATRSDGGGREIRRAALALRSDLARLAADWAGAVVP
jgi:cytochrome c peroxidase